MSGHVLLICGPAGVGKSTIGFEVYMRALAAGLCARYLDLGQTGFVRPDPPADPGRRQLMARNLAAVWRNYHAAGARHLVATVPAGTAADVQAFADALPDLGEKAGIGALDPAIVRRRRMGVAKAWSFTDAIESAAERSKDGIFAIAPRPKPRGIDVRVADDVQDLALLAIRNRCADGCCRGSAKRSRAAQQEFAP